MRINAKVLLEVTHTHDRVKALVSNFYFLTTGVHLEDEDDYEDFTESLMDILLDYTHEVGNG